MTCGLCGESIPEEPNMPGMARFDVEMGEFWNPETQDSVVAHASCGLDAGLETA